MPLDIADIRNNAQLSYDYFYEGREQCVDDIHFAFTPGYQWRDSFSQYNEKATQKLEINKLVHPINQAIGRYNQAQITGNIIPDSADADDKIAKVFSGVLRKVEDLSNAQDIYSDAFVHIVSGGFSAWKLSSQFRADTFDQELVIKAIPDPFFSVWPDPGARTWHSKDWKFALIQKRISKKEFRKRFKGALEVDYNTNETTNSPKFKWSDDSTITIAEYWEVTEKKSTLVRLPNGQIFDEDNPAFKLVRDQFDFPADEIQTRPYTKKIVNQYLVSGSEILEDATLWPGNWIPIIPCYAYRLFIDNDFRYRGKVRYAKDGQRLFNYAATAIAKASASSPKDPIFVTPEQTNKLKRFYEGYNRNDNPFIYYNHVDGQPPPFKLGAPSLQTALINILQQADLYIQAAMGDFNATLGRPEGDQSGIAINKLQEQSDAGNFDMTLAIARSIKFTWETMMDVASKFYDNSRFESVLDAEGSEESIEINKTVFNPETGETEILNDLGQGRYKVLFDVGPGVKTARQEALAVLDSIRRSDPNIAAVTSDLVIKLMGTMPFKTEIVERIRKSMINQGLIEPNDAEKEELVEKNPPDPTQEIVQQAQIESLLLENEDKKVDIEKKAAQTDEIQAKIAKAMADTLKTYVEAGIGPSENEVLIKRLQSEQFINDIINQAAISQPQPTPQSPAPVPGENGEILP